MLWACLLLPHLALDTVLRRRPDPARPLALVEGPAQLRTVHAVNAAAADAGLKPGMRLAAAYALLPGVDTHEHDPDDATRCLRWLAGWAYRHSSMVATPWPDAIVLEVHASFRLLGPWPRMQARLREELDALGLNHRIGLAPTPRAAYVFAMREDGFGTTHPAAMRQALAGMSVRRAALPGDAGEQLHRMGVRTLDALRGMPRDGLRRRFGQALLDHLDRLHGDVDDAVTCYAPPDHFDMRIELGHEVEHHPALLFPLRRLVQDLAAYLSGRDGGVQRFVMRLEHESGHSDVAVGLLAAERDGPLLFEIARNRLEQASIPRPVMAMRLLARELPAFVPAVRDLFDTRPTQAMPWPQLHERLRARLGDGAVYRVAATGDPRPERAWRRVEDDTDVSACAVLAPQRPPRPAWLLPHPVPLRDASARIVSGPERLESGWWDDGDTRRDYYVLETSSGQQAWAFAPPGEQGGWMLHGWFA